MCNYVNIGALRQATVAAAAAAAAPSVSPSRAGKRQLTCVHLCCTLPANRSTCCLPDVYFPGVRTRRHPELVATSQTETVLSTALSVLFSQCSQLCWRQCTHTHTHICHTVHFMDDDASAANVVAVVELLLPDCQVLVEVDAFLHWVNGAMATCEPSPFTICRTDPLLLKCHLSRTAIQSLMYLQLKCHC